MAFSQLTATPGCGASGRLDGYSFFYPDTWQIDDVRNDVFYRNPRIADENVFVDITSPSSAATPVRLLGTPGEPARGSSNGIGEGEHVTRIGIRREFGCKLMNIGA
jgi:hypothetical protein